MRRSIFAGLFVAGLVACSVSEHTTAGDTQELNDVGFSDLSLVDLDFPANPGHPLTADDITVIKGYDGKTPEEAAKIIRAAFVGQFDSSFDDFFHQRTLDVHKQWTLVIANSFAANFPAAKFVATVASSPNTRVFVIATPRGDIYLKTTNPDDGEQWYLASGNSFKPVGVAGGFKPFTPPIADAELRVNPPGIKIDYPAWAWAPLAHGAVITEEGDDGGLIPDDDGGLDSGGP